MSLPMSDRTLPAPQTLSELPNRILDEVMRQLRTARNDIVRYAVWNIRNLTDDDFNRTDDQKLLSYFRQDLLETRILTRGRKIDLVQLWHWFDHQMSGVEPMIMSNGEEVFLNIQDKDLDKVRKRISEIESFFPTLRGDDLEAFKRVKFKLRRTVMRLTYDLHHVHKRLEKYRKNVGFPMAGRDLHTTLEAAIEVPEPPSIEEVFPAGETVDA